MEEQEPIIGDTWVLLSDVLEEESLAEIVGTVPGVISYT